MSSASASSSYYFFPRMARAEGNFPPPCHSVIFSLLANIFAHLQLKSKFMTISPYEEHKGTTMAAYISLFTYAASLVAEFGWEIHNQALLTIIKRLSYLLGAFTVVMHMLMLHPPLGWFLLKLWIIYLIGAVLWSLGDIKQVYECLSLALPSIKEKIEKYIHSIGDKIRNYFGG